jgi:DNA-binding MarR family transcriptional regulator
MKGDQDRVPSEKSDSTVIDDASRSLFRFGRAFARLPMRDLLAGGGAQASELSAILVVQSVEAAYRDGQDVTVGAIAAQLGIDPSTASRLVAQAERAGLIDRRASPRDARASFLSLTAKGRVLADGAARYQRVVFESATGDWSVEEKQSFARLFLRFTDAIVTALEQDHKR